MQGETLQISLMKELSMRGLAIHGASIENREPSPQLARFGNRLRLPYVNRVRRHATVPRHILRRPARLHLRQRKDRLHIPVLTLRNLPFSLNARIICAGANTGE
jgi:hypothetical protein